MSPLEHARAPIGVAVWAIALVSFVLHLLPHPGYGFHRDELLYLAMGDHLNLFRMSFPPLIAILAQAARLFRSISSPPSDCGRRWPRPRCPS